MRRSLGGVTDGAESLYERVGGQAWFDDLVERFYVGVESDPVLRPLYPEDLEPGKRHLALFFGQYWGGPSAYSAGAGPSPVAGPPPARSPSAWPSATPGSGTWWPPSRGPR